MTSIKKEGLIKYSGQYLKSPISASTSQFRLTNISLVQTILIFKRWLCLSLY